MRSVRRKNRVSRRSNTRRRVSRRRNTRKNSKRRVSKRVSRRKSRRRVSKRRVSRRNSRRRNTKQYGGTDPTNEEMLEMIEHLQLIGPGAEDMPPFYGTIIQEGIDSENPNDLQAYMAGFLDSHDDIDKLREKYGNITDEGINTFNHNLSRGNYDNAFIADGGNDIQAWRNNERIVDIVH